MYGGRRLHLKDLKVGGFVEKVWGGVDGRVSLTVFKIGPKLVRIG